MGMRRYNHIYKRYYPLNLKLQLLCWFGFYGRFRDKISWKMTLKCVFNSEMYIIYALWHQNHHPYRLIIEFGTNARTSDSAASTVPLGIRFILSSLLSCSHIYAFFCDLLFDVHGPKLQCVQLNNSRLTTITRYSRYEKGKSIIWTQSIYTYNLECLMATSVFSYSKTRNRYRKDISLIDSVSVFCYQHFPLRLWEECIVVKLAALNTNSA